MTLLGHWTRQIAFSSVAAMALAAGTAAQANSHDDSFTIAVLPDTQNYIDYIHQKVEGFPFDASQQFLEQMEYVAANVESVGGDIAFVTSLGDVWQHQSLTMDPAHIARGFKSAPNPFFDEHLAPTPKVKTVEMPMALKGYQMIAGKVPFSVVPGNHDHDAMWTDINHPPAKEFKDSFDNLGDAIEAVNARKGKMAQTLMLPANPSQYPPERGADIDIYSINKNEKGHRTGHIIARIPTALNKKSKKGDDNGI